VHTFKCLPCNTTKISPSVCAHIPLVQVGLVWRDGLDASNLLLRGCTLRKTEWVIGVVIFTGGRLFWLQLSLLFSLWLLYGRPEHPPKGVQDGTWVTWVTVHISMIMYATHSPLASASSWVILTTFLTWQGTAMGLCMRLHLEPCCIIHKVSCVPPSVCASFTACIWLICLRQQCCCVCCRP
jgi:hypothetical protein